MIPPNTVANVVATGSFTIPMMKKIGYRKHVAAAVEAAASTGGQLMPPIMGAGAFVMASYTQIPYTHIVVVSFYFDDEGLLIFIPLYFHIDGLLFPTLFLLYHPDDLFFSEGFILLIFFLLLMVNAVFAVIIANLFMAGRCISVTHEALGTVRVMRNGALMGEGPFTVFAPTDEAFAKLPEGTLEALIEDPIGEIDGRQTVGDRNRRAPLHERVQRSSGVPGLGVLLRQHKVRPREVRGGCLF